MLRDKRICILGAGAMGEALIAGLLKNNLLPPQQIAVLGRREERLLELHSRYGVSILALKEAVSKSDIMILAVKPKDLKSALLEVQPYTDEQQLFISVIAGISTESISNILGHRAPVIRTMPNTSAHIGLSATALAPGSTVNDNQLLLATAIFASIGIVVQVTEDKLHAVTGLSGSGPAYVYYLVECMQNAGEQIGLEASVARSLILHTIIGAAHMLLETMEEPSVLREKVTSPNGTTAAGISILEEYAFQDAIKRCIQRATERSYEMGKEYISS